MGHESSRRWPRFALAGFAVLLAVGAAGGGALAGPAGAVTSRGPDGSPCTVSFTGHGHSNLWSDPANWSTGQVPGPASDVCVLQVTAPAIVAASGPVTVHSLTVGSGMAVYFTGPPDNPSVVTITAVLGDQGEVVMAGTSITAATVKLTGAGLVAAQGTNMLTSPAIEDDASAPGGIAVLDGTLTLAGSRQPRAGRRHLSGDTSDGLAPAATALTMQAGSSLSMSPGALSAQTVTVGQGAVLSAGGSITGNLVNDGTVAAADRLMVTGGYTQGPDGVLGAGFGQELQVTGTAALTGKLMSALPPGTPPGARATAITFSSATGGFTSHNPGIRLVKTASQIDVIATHDDPR